MVLIFVFFIGLLAVITASNVFMIYVETMTKMGNNYIWFKTFYFFFQFVLQFLALEQSPIYCLENLKM